MGSNQLSFNHLFERLKNCLIRKNDKEFKDVPQRIYYSYNSTFQPFIFQHQFISALFLSQLEIIIVFKDKINIKSFLKVAEKKVVPLYLPCFLNLFSSGKNTLKNSSFYNPLKERIIISFF